jgi:hypothetical protein
LVRIFTLLLMITSVVFLTVGRKTERSMEAIQAIFLPYVLIGMVFICITVVPSTYWLEAVRGLLIPAAPPAGSDISVLGRIASFTALASGLNFMFSVYYRDKGFGMGSKTGYLAGMFARYQPLLSTSGVTFAESPQNSRAWKQWFRYLLIDQWGIYFIGAVLGIFLPTLLVAYLAKANPASLPNGGNILVYAATQLGAQFGPLLSGWTLLTGFVILFTTQLVILDLLARNLTEALYALSSRLRRTAGHDPRRIYYPALVAITGGMAGLIFSGAPDQILYGPQLSLLAANLANFAALVFPLLLIYLNLKLPRPARITWWSVLVLLSNALFFGFFFINFLAVQINGAPLMSF